MNKRFFFQMGRLFIEMVKTALQTVKGVYKLLQMRGPIVTVFGATIMHKDAIYYKQAYELSYRLVQYRCSIITGGGPGIMYAANCGAKSMHTTEKMHFDTLGIAVRGVDEKFSNCCSPLTWVDHFFIRKWLLMNYSSAFVVFPGGLGTIDELFELLNALKHKKINSSPVILMGVSFWQPLIDWMRDFSVAQGYMHPEAFDFFIVTDSVDVAVERIKSFVLRHKDTDF